MNLILQMILIVDANILIGELLRKRGRKLIQNTALKLYISQKALEETFYELNKRIISFQTNNDMSDEEAEDTLSLIKSIINLHIQKYEQKNYIHLESEARKRIPNDPNDWETIALALLLNSSPFIYNKNDFECSCPAIWTQDKDFLGCGFPTWTTDTLLLYLNSIS